MSARTRLRASRVRRVRHVLGLGALILAAVPLSACAPAARPGSLPPTLELVDHDGAQVAVQNGIPVPTFDPQPRPRIDLGGRWRVQRRTFDPDLSLTHRQSALAAILAEAEGREQPAYDDRAWDQLPVPGVLNAPPAGREVGAWYRRSFYVPNAWEGQVATLKMGAVNYLADVWVNGQYVGYHEGGYTPFAFDISALLQPGARNAIAVRVDNPAWGLRNDIVPWGLADWWNYGGITQPAWIEASPPLHIVRADVVPHLDGVDVAVTLRHADAVIARHEESSPATSVAARPSATGEAAEAEPGLRVEILSAEVTPENLADPQAASLADRQAAPLATDALALPALEPGGLARLETAFLLGGADRWSPSHPALYVLHAALSGSQGGDELWTSFGLRHVAVDPQHAELELNGAPTAFTGVGLHDERLEPASDGAEERTRGHRIVATDELLAQLDRASQVDAELIRAGHTPANPMLLTLTDRLGFAVWEEIPLYHYTPLTFQIAMHRGIPQQMLREMALRDMNRPSVLFHGLANESTGTDERTVALKALHDVDRQIDGTRLTGQASYGFQPDDPTHAPLDVAGYTFYYGVFYRDDPASGTARAIEEAHAAHPDKPIMALEFGRWADGPGGPALQQRIFELTYQELELRSVERGGYVGATVWWALEDFATMRPGIGIEHFGLFDPFGEPRPAAASAARLFAAVAGEGAQQMIVSEVQRAAVARQLQADLRLLGYLAFAILFSIGLLALAVAALTHRGGRATGVRSLRRTGR